MRVAVFGVLVALAATGVQGQWFETTVPADSSPTSLCHNTRDDYVYCANWGGDNVTVIDGATNSVVTNVAVGEEPHGVVYSPVSNKVFCLDERSTTLSVIDGATNVVVAVESLHTRPWDGVWCPVNNSVYILGHNPDVVVVVDCSTYAIEATIPFPASPYGICYDSTDNRVYIATRADSTVRAIDCSADSVIATVHVGPAPNKLCWNSRENKVYTATASSQDSTVWVIDCASNTVAATLVVGQFPIAIGYDPAESRVYATNYSSRSISVIDGAADSVVATVPTTGSPWGFCAAPEYGHVFCSVRNDTVLVLDAATASVIARVGVGEAPNDLLYNPLDSRVYSADYDGATVSIMRGTLVGIEREAVLRLAAAPGTHVVCGSLRLPGTAARAVLLNPVGRRVARLTPGENDVRHLSPGVYFLESDGGGQGIRKVVLAR